MYVLFFLLLHSLHILHEAALYDRCEHQTVEDSEYIYILYINNILLLKVNSDHYSLFIE